MTASATPTDRTDQDCIAALRRRLNSVLRGKPAVIEDVLTCLLAGGHLLLEDKPGLGKTTLAKALAESIGGEFARVQCTPDLLPADVTGFSIFNQREHEFEFRRGPVFADVLLADEINRATPRTQSALLEAMAERQVTVDSVRHPLASRFFVIATQNPIDQHGTYPLPEAQLDRFAMKLSFGYAAVDDELQMLQDAVGAARSSAGPVTPELSPGQLETIQSRVAELFVDRSIQRYLIAIAAATRNHPQIQLGLSPRGLLVWQRVSQARAWLNQRDFVLPDDVQQTAQQVLGVRLGVSHSSSRGLISEILDATEVPTNTSSRPAPSVLVQT